MGLIKSETCCSTRTLVASYRFNHKHNLMIKKTSLFLAGYFVIITALYFLFRGNQFTPSKFGFWAKIITPVYLFLFILIVTLQKSKNEK